MFKTMRSGLVSILFVTLGAIIMPPQEGQLAHARSMTCVQSTKRIIYKLTLPFIFNYPLAVLRGIGHAAGDRPHLPGHVLKTLQHLGISNIRPMVKEHVSTGNQTIVLQLKLLSIIE